MNPYNVPGWDDAWQNLWNQRFADTELEPGRVMTVQRNLCRVACAGDERLLTLSGRMMREMDAGAAVVAVGDFVAVRRAAGGGVIEGLLPRRTAFSRPDGFSAQGVQVMCANIDILFIVQALGHDYNPRRMERYLTAAWDSGAVPVLVLNKADTDRKSTRLNSSHT